MQKEKSLRVERLKQRAKYCCCRYCGGEMNVRQIVFHTYAEALRCGNRFSALSHAGVKGL